MMTAREHIHVLIACRDAFEGELWEYLGACSTCVADSEFIDVLITCRDVFEDDLSRALEAGVIHIADEAAGCIDRLDEKISEMISGVYIEEELGERIDRLNEEIWEAYVDAHFTGELDD